MIDRFLVLGLVLLSAGPAAARERAAVISTGRATGATAAAIATEELGRRFDPAEVGAALREELASAAGAETELSPQTCEALADPPVRAVAVISGGRRAVHIVLYDAVDGAVLLNQWQRLRRGKVDPSRLRTELQAAMARIPEEAPAETAAAPDPAPRAELVAPAADEGEERAFELLRVRVLGGLAARSFGFNDPITPQLRDHTLPAAPSVRGELEVYPLPVHVGLVGSFGFSPGVSSKLEDTGATVSSSLTEWQAGAIARLALGRTHLSGLLTLGGLDLDFDGAGAVAAELPSVQYLFARVAVGLAYQVSGSWQVLGELAVRPLLSSGDLGERFPNATGGAVDGAIGAAYELGSGFSLLGRARYLHHFQDFGSVPGDARVAGGALDLYGSAEMGVELAW